MSQQKKGDKHKDEKDLDDSCRRAFEIFDKNGDGTISLCELGKIMRCLNLNPTDKQVEEAARKLDKDGNGRCDFNDFKLFMQEQTTSQEDFEEELMQAFRIFDQDGNNFIEAKEIRTILTNLGEPLTDEELRYMIKTADLNGDGKLDYQEFVKLCLQPCL